MGWSKKSKRLMQRAAKGLAGAFVSVAPVMGAVMLGPIGSLAGGALGSIAIDPLFAGVRVVNRISIERDVYNPLRWTPSSDRWTSRWKDCA